VANSSPRMLWPYPEQRQDPWYEVFVDLIRALDASGFAAREDRNLILTGGGLMSWFPGGAGLTWDSDFLVFSPSTGFFSRIVANSLAPDDGQVIRAEIVRHPGQNVNVAAEVASIAKNTDDSLILGIRLGTNFIFRNGMIIQTGTVIPAEDFWSGGGGGGGGLAGAFKYVAPSEYISVPSHTQINVDGRVIIDGRVSLNGHMRFIGRWHTPPKVLQVVGEAAEIPNNCIVPVDPTNGPFTLTLKPRGVPGEGIELFSISDDPVPPSVTIFGNGPLIGGLPSIVMDTPREVRRLIRKRGHGLMVY
jgi:hypothetical protein